MTLQEKVQEAQRAYKVLRMFVRNDEYFAYLQGLMEARELEIKNMEDGSNVR